jgi:hypothetical protein
MYSSRAARIVWRSNVGAGLDASWADHLQLRNTFVWGTAFVTHACPPNPLCSVKSFGYITTCPHDSTTFHFSQARSNHSLPESGDALAIYGMGEETMVESMAVGLT